MRKFNGFLNGINLGGWYSQCDYSLDRFNNFIKEEDFKTISSWGMDHVRVPIDYNLVQNDDMSFKEDGFRRIEETILLCQKYNLNMILDLHKTIGYSFDAEENEDGFFTSVVYQNNFYNLWEELTKRFSKYENMLALELLNEVTDSSFKDKWNEISSNCIKKIRSISPTIKILVGGYNYNAVSAVKDIDIPFDDNIILNFHCYEPLIFTHQGAYWVDGMDVNYRFKYNSTFKEVKEESIKHIKNHVLDYSFMNDNEKIGPHYFEMVFKEAIDYAESKNVSLYCGEYGVIEYVLPEDIKAWYHDINSVLNQNGIGHAIWSYKEMDFDFKNPKFDSIRKDIIG